MPGMPAARLSDQCAHGGTIVMGFPMVLIEGLPAARVGDMHVCPMFDGPKPHVGGPILKGSMGVLIGNMPAARVMDQCTCVGPPDMIAKGASKVLIGDGAPSGGASSGSGGQGSGEAEDQQAEITEISESQSNSGESAEQTEDHFLDVQFVDSANNPITDTQYSMTDPVSNESGGILAGAVGATGVEPGNYEIGLHTIVSTKWSKTAAKVGETVTMTAETAGIDDGAKARLEIWVHDPNYSTRMLKLVETEVSGGKIEGDWTIEVDDAFVQIVEEKEALGQYSSPSYYFIATAMNFSKRSGMLLVTDDVEITLKDKDGNSVPDKKYKVYLPTGEVRQGRLDGSGYAKETDVPAGRVRVAFDVRDESWGG